MLTTIVTENPIRFVFDAPESALLKYKREAGGAREQRGRDPPAGRDRVSLEGPRRLPRQRARPQLRHDPRPRGGRQSRRLHLARHVRPDAAVRAAAVRCAALPDEAIVTDQTRQVVYVVDAEGIVGQKVVQPGPADRRLARDPRRASRRTDRVDHQRRAARAARPQGDGDGRRGQRVSRPAFRAARTARCRCRRRRQRAAAAEAPRPCASRISSSTGRSSPPRCRWSSR